MIISLIKTNVVRTEQLKVKELRFFLNRIVGYERYVMADGAEEVWLYQDTFHASHYKSFDWDKDSWERMVCALENHFTEPEIIPNSNPPSGTAPGLNYYY